jgi:hypothetical protein
MYTLNVYEWPYSMCIQGLLLTLNGFHIMVPLCIYFEYINVLYKFHGHEKTHVNLFFYIHVGG